MKKLTAFGKYTTKLRKSKNISLSDMAAKVGISVSYLCNIESGRYKVPTYILETIAKVFELTIVGKLELYAIYLTDGTSDDLTMDLIKLFSVNHQYLTDDEKNKMIDMLS